MSIDASTFPMVLAFAAPFFVLCVALEWWAVRSGKVSGRYDIKDAWTSMLMGLLLLEAPRRAPCSLVLDCACCSSQQSAL